MLNVSEAGASDGAPRRGWTQSLAHSLGELGGWRPSVSTKLGATFTEMRGSVMSMDDMGGVLRPSDRDRELVETPHLAIAIELASPQVKIGGIETRLFAAAEVMPSFAIERNLAAEEDPSGPTPPPNATLGFLESAISGRGSRTTATVAPLMYGFAFGAELQGSIADIDFWVRPSARWLRYEVDVRGKVIEAQKPNPIGTDFRTIALNAHGSLYMSGIGPAVEVEFDAGEVGPFRARAFVEAGAYRILGDRDLNLYDSVSIDDAIGMDRFEARWSMEADPWLYRVGIGVRVSIPEAR